MNDEPEEGHDEEPPAPPRFHDRALEVARIILSQTPNPEPGDPVVLTDPVLDELYRQTYAALLVTINKAANEAEDPAAISALVNAFYTLPSPDDLQTPPDTAG